MARVALYTFFVFKKPREHPQSKGFVDRAPQVYQAAANASGFVDHSASGSEHDPRWGDRNISPRFFTGERHTDAPASLSLWEDLESVYAFAYSGRHGEALSHRKEWIRQSEWPTYVAWWVGDDEVPTRQEACQRLEYLHDHGPTPHAFNFKSPFDPEGRPARLDMGKVQELSKLVREHAENNPIDL